MSDVQMPEPVAWMLAIQTMGGDIGWKLSWTQSGAGVCNRLSGESHEKPLITTTQAQAYADAVRRETLEEAAKAVIKELYPTNPIHDWTDIAHGHAKSAVLAEQAIRQLIPTQPMEKP